MVCQQGVIGHLANLSLFYRAVVMETCLQAPTKSSKVCMHTNLILLSCLGSKNIVAQYNLWFVHVFIGHDAA